MKETKVTRIKPSDVFVAFTGFSFALVFITTIAFLLRTGSSYDLRTGYTFMYVGVCTALAILVACRLLTDGIAKARVRTLLLYASLGFFLIGSFLQMLAADNVIASYITVILLVLALCLDAILWFCFLASLEHGKLLLYFDICFGLAAASIFFGLLGALASTFIVVLAALSFFFLYAFVVGKDLRTTIFPSKVDSKHIEQHTKIAWAKSPPLIAVGVLAGFPIVYSFLHMEKPTLVILLVVSLVLAGALFGLLRLRYTYKIEDFLFHYTPVFFCVGQFALPFTSGAMTQVCLCYLLVFAFAQVFIASDAILESVRLFRVSPIWITSTQFSKIFIGFTISLFVTVIINEYLTLFMGNVLEVFVVVFLVVFLTCFVPKTGYPNPETALGDLPVKEKQHRPRWNEALDSVTSIYGLSPREREVLGLFAKGHTSTAIAKILFISISTTRTHIANIYSKLNIHSKEELLMLLQGERDMLDF